MRSFVLKYNQKNILNMNKKDLEEMLLRTDKSSLIQWLVDYTKDNPDFEQLLQNRFNPKNIKVESAKDYPAIIRAAFSNNPYKSRSRYSSWDEYGFEAEGVRADLENVLEEAEYFLRNKNTKVSVEICKNIIEIVPEEWDEQFDYDGDVQVIYDEAIDKLEMMLKDALLPENEKSELFEWYKNEGGNTNKHKYVGLNTSLDALQRYFMSSEEMIVQNLKSLDEKIKNVSERYNKERYVIEKIEILEEVGNFDEMQQTIDEYLKFPGVRRMRLESLIRERKYDLAMELIQGGIAVAEMEGHSGTVLDWKDELLRIAQYQNDKTEVLRLAEDLLYKGREYRKYYDILKAETPTENWDSTLTRLISNIKSGAGLWGFNRFLADVLVEHQKWSELFDQCKKGGVEYLEQYEKYLRPAFDQEIYEIYLSFIEEQATITNQKAYEYVAHYLKRLKTFSGGNKKAAELIAQYRVVYKRRRNMMKELERV